LVGKRERNKEGWGAAMGEELNGKLHELMMLKGRKYCFPKQH